MTFTINHIKTFMSEAVGPVSYCFLTISIYDAQTVFSNSYDVALKGIKEELCRAKGSLPWQHQQ